VRFLQYPQQRNISQAVVGITAADIGVHSGKPNLANTVRGAITCEFLALIPHERVEGRALVIKSKCVMGSLDLLAELEILER
jgi:hypothetical protein